MAHRDTRSSTPDSVDEDSTNECPRTSSNTCSSHSTDVSTSEDVLTTLADSDCRTTLAARTERPCSGSKIIDTCEISEEVSEIISDKLVHTKFNIAQSQSQIRIRLNGRNKREYSPRIHTLHVSLTDSGPPEAVITRDDGPDNTRFGQVITDGGETNNSDTEGSDSNNLCAIFVSITGEEELVDEQDIDMPVRHLSDDGEDTVSEYISSVTRDDGLADSLPDSQSQE